jgi:hypothetical protein
MSPGSPSPSRTGTCGSNFLAERGPMSARILGRAAEEQMNGVKDRAKKAVLTGVVSTCGQG